MNPNFEKITFIGIDGIGTDLNILKALKYTQNQIPNSKYKFLTSGIYNLVDGIEIIQIPPLNYSDFSKFCLTQLKNYINTDFIIICQGDGFVTNVNEWDDQFINYDYIGAPWNCSNFEYDSHIWELIKIQYKKIGCKYTIGNGGFSIRSKKLMFEVSKLYKDEYYGIPEDLVICLLMREQLEKNGLKFPKSIELAAKFSCEATYVDGHNFSSDKSFGFHSRNVHPDKVKLLERVIL